MGHSGCGPGIVLLPCVTPLAGCSDSSSSPGPFLQPCSAWWRPTCWPRSTRSAGSGMHPAKQPKLRDTDKFALLRNSAWPRWQRREATSTNGKEPAERLSDASMQWLKSSLTGWRQRDRSLA
jgi:hypothetical protein